ncbi:MAG: VOC family protein [Chloroflexota bacterium]
MITRFDHIIIAARDLDAAMQLYTNRLGLDAQFGGQHTGRGTHNAIVRFGLDYLEILSVVDQEELRSAPAKRVRLLDFLDHQEGGLLAYCLATDDIDGLAEHFRTTGLDALGPFDMERTRPDGVLLKWRLLIPDGSAYRQPWPFFIEWEMPDAERLTYETPGQHPLGVTRVAGVTVTVAALSTARYLYGEQLGLTLHAEDEVSQLGAARLRYQLGSFGIDLLAPIGEGPVQNELEQKGEGVYSVTMTVKSLDVAKRALEERGLEWNAPAGYDELIMPKLDKVMGSRLWLSE